MGPAGGASVAPPPQPGNSSSLLLSLHFWTSDPGGQVAIRDTDFGVFRLHDKQELKELQEDTRRHYAQDKLSYCELRGHNPSVEAKRAVTWGKGPSKGSSLRSGLRELETLLSEQTVLFSSFRGGGRLFQLVLASGAVATASLSRSGDLQRVSVDRFLCGGRVSMELACQAHFARRVLAVAYLDSRLTLVFLGRGEGDEGEEDARGADEADGDEGTSVFERTLDKRDARIATMDVLGPPGRRIPRHLSLSDNGSHLLCWWSCQPGQDVFPWAPHLRDEDRANVMLFKVGDCGGGGGGAARREEPLASMGYIRTPTDPIAIRFYPPDLPLPAEVTRSSAPLIQYICQDTNRKGETQLEMGFLQALDGDRQLRRRHPRRLSLFSPVACHEFVGGLLVLSCVDGTLAVVDPLLDHEGAAAAPPRFVRRHPGAGFIAARLRAHPDGALVVAASERGLLHCFDLALTPVRLQFGHSEADSPAAAAGTALFLDCGQYLNAPSSQPTLADVQFCPREPTPLGGDSNGPMAATATNYLAIRFHGGPIALARISAGVFNAGALGPVQITNQYISSKQFHQALLLLSQLDWSRQAAMLMGRLNAVFNRLARSWGGRARGSGDDDVEALMEMCLGLFYAPQKPIPEEVLDEYSDQVRDLSRRFFHLLLRRGRLAKSFRLAVDINDYDLFMDIFHAATAKGNVEMAEAAAIKARSIYESGPSDSSPSGSLISGDEDSPRPVGQSQLQYREPPRRPNNFGAERTFSAMLGQPHSEADFGEEDDDLPPPPPSPPRSKDQQQQMQQHQRQQLPSPMQLFSAVSTVQVDPTGAASTSTKETRNLPQDAKDEEEDYDSSESVLRYSVNPPVPTQTKMLQQQQKHWLETQQLPPHYREPPQPRQQSIKTATTATTQQQLPEEEYKRQLQQQQARIFQQRQHHPGVRQRFLQPVANVLPTPTQQHPSEAVTRRAAPPTTGAAAPNLIMPSDVSATYARTTSAKLIPTTAFGAAQSDEASAARASVALAKLNVSSSQRPEDIEVVPFGFV